MVCRGGGAGNMNRRITIQRKSTVTDSAGQQVETWTDLAFKRAAGWKPTRGSERFASNQYAAREQATFHIHYSANVADLNPLDRIIYPASDTPDDPAPPGQTVYDVLAVLETGYREGLDIQASRRPEQ